MAIITNSIQTSPSFTELSLIFQPNDGGLAHGESPKSALVVTSLDDEGKVEGYQLNDENQVQIMNILSGAKPIAGKMQMDSRGGGGGGLNQQTLPPPPLTSPPSLARYTNNEVFLGRFMLIE